MFLFDHDSLLYFLTKLKEIFATEKELEKKVDKEPGKDLTTNNFTNDYANTINVGIDDVTVSSNKDITVLSFYATSVDGVKTKVTDISIDI